jgi:hypothetical protein
MLKKKKKKKKKESAKKINTIIVELFIDVYL